ncbi:hypothetical protein CLV30_103263 [Haloactinopolyspora alba]|uniref:Uncharacterized protein n=1 Tax=Haloactinopolyspora alba TaxID=648780 RepID=A0A2P8E9H8_9ACTN|nr:DUF5819 family protein [Haloactinopolyspora alba]PSL06108.1 hypothetical protein CLV30_103263 [Haloactinopolyspora alba]
MSKRTEETPGNRPIWIKVVAGMLGALLCAHLFATAVYVGPANAAKQSLGESLTSYMYPMFQQDWNLFAPTPISVEYDLLVRGWYDDERSTDWVSATETEVDGNVLHSLAPSRAGIVTRRLAGHMREQYREVTPAERSVLSGDYHTDAWDRMEARMVALDEHSSDERISYVLRLDRAMAAYATQFVWARWGRDQDFAYVEFKIRVTRAPRFDDRGDEPEVTERQFGRRPLYRYDAQDEGAFTDAIERFGS